MQPSLGRSGQGSRNNQDKNKISNKDSHVIKVIIVFIVIVVMNR